MTATNEPRLTRKRIEEMLEADGWTEDSCMYFEELCRLALIGLATETSGVISTLQEYAEPLNHRTRSGKVGITLFTDGRDSDLIDGQFTGGKLAREALAKFKEAMGAT